MSGDVARCRYMVLKLDGAYLLSGALILLTGEYLLRFHMHGSLPDLNPQAATAEITSATTDATQQGSSSEYAYYSEHTLKTPPSEIA